MSDGSPDRSASAQPRFEDKGEIARGGMGTVRETWDRLLGRRIALKELWRHDDPTATQRFLDEARIMGGLDHPNVLPVHDLCLDPDGGTPRLLMKLVEGRTLSEVLHESDRPAEGGRLESLLRAILKVCDAVAFAHSRGVIHRDLHPRNVMVGTHGQVYVMDWGLAVRLGQPAAPAAPSGVATASGTAAYMAPEQAWGRDAEIDERTDVFGVGGMLYEVLTLRPPFAGDAFHDVINLARRCEILPPGATASGSGPPARLCDIVMRALAANRSDRYQTIDALRDDLEAFLRSGGWFPAQQFLAGALMLREGHVGERAYILSHGTCEVFRTVGDRTEVIRTVGPGGIVGEVGLFTRSPRVASVRAVTDVSALVVTPDALERELGRAGWMRAFVGAAIERFVELDELRRQVTPAKT